MVKNVNTCNTTCVQCCDMYNAVTRTMRVETY